ncbi:MAG: hypothetical protein R2818_00510 [Flavobacteriales bacterium]
MKIGKAGGAPDPGKIMPVFVLTHHPRPLVMEGGTTFHFVTEVIEVRWNGARSGRYWMRGAAALQRCASICKLKSIDELEPAKGLRARRRRAVAGRDRLEEALALVQEFVPGERAGFYRLRRRHAGSQQSMS